MYEWVKDRQKAGEPMQIAAIVISVFILYRVQALIYQRIWDRQLKADVSFVKEKVTEGETVELEEVLENRKWLPLPVVFLTFKMSKYFKDAQENAVLSNDRYTRNELLSVMMFQRRKRRIELVCTRRGKYKIEQATLQAQSLFLDEKYIKNISCESCLTVYPGYVDAKRFVQLIENVYGSQAMRPFMQEDPFLHRGVREYQVYDSMRNINWNATAKTGSMKVNLLETLTNQQVSVYLNMQKESLSVHNEVLEESIRLAKTFCAFFSRKGIKSALYTNGCCEGDDEPVCVKKRDAGIAYMGQVNEALTRIVLDETGNVVKYGREQELDFVSLYQEQIKEDSKDSQILLISCDQNARIMQLMKELFRQRKSFLWVVPVDYTSSFHAWPELREHMKIWRLNFEGASREAVK